MTDLHANYLLDLGYLIRENAEKAKNGLALASDDDRAFEQGRLSAYHEVLSLMQQQAVAFELPLQDLALDGLDADRDLL